MNWENRKLELQEKLYLHLKDSKGDLESAEKFFNFIYSPWWTKKEVVYLSSLVIHQILAAGLKFQDTPTVFQSIGTRIAGDKRT